MIICPNCGAKNEEGEILCGECGSKLKGPAKQIKPIIPAEPMKFVEVAAPERKLGSVEAVVTPERECVTNEPEVPKYENVSQELAAADTAGPANEGSKWREADLAAEEPKKSRMTSGIVVLIVVIAAVMFYGLIPTLIESHKRKSTGISLESYSVGVELFDEEGQKESINEGKILCDGDSVRTDKYGEAYMKLGAARSLRMLLNSEIQVHKAEEATWIVMKKGAMFFCIDNPFRETETLELDAGAMSVSMSEAAGYMYYNGKDEARIWVMNGEVRVVIYDEASGEQLMETLTPGEYAFGVFDDNGISCTVDRAFLEDLPSAMVRKIAETPELLNRVSQDSGWYRQDIIELANQYKAEEMQLNYIFPSWLLDD